MVYAYGLALTFEIGDNGTYYTNGNVVDFLYHFENYIANAAGTINTYMDLIPSTDFKIGADWFGFVDYTTDFFGSESKDDVLVVTIYDIHSATIWRTASGEYDHSAYYTTPYTQVIIDPDTGKVLDMLELNYYYEYGNQNSSYSSVNN